MEYRGFILDPFQEQAIHAVEANQSVVVSAPTGSGKTLIADYIIDKKLHAGKRVIYTAPIKALSNQKYKDFCSEFGDDNIGLLTGDIVRNPHAPILIMTTEIYRNMALINDPVVQEISYVIFDEIHYINDVERGYVWEESIIFSQEHVRFLCLSATIPNADEFGDWIRAIKQHDLVVIHSTQRKVPLHRNFYDTELGITTLEKIKQANNIPSYRHIVSGKGRRRAFLPGPNHTALIKEIRDKLPCLFFCFSRKACQENAKQLWKEKIFETNPKISSIIRIKLQDAPSEIRQLRSTRTLLQTLPQGIGFHHAGLIPIIKELVEDLFSKSLLNVLYTTETFAVGINMPAKTVCFASLRKYDGIQFRHLNSKEYFQIAGRAGRRGIDTEGFVYALIERRDFDYQIIKKMTDEDKDPIKSQFRLSVNTVLNLLEQHSKEEIEAILRMNYYTFQRYGMRFMQVNRKEIYASFDRIRRRLLKYQYITKANTLTDKGYFSSRIYADEILTGELFATDFYKKLSNYEVMLLIGTLAYEPRERTEFHKTFDAKTIAKLRRKTIEHPLLKKDKRFKHMEDVTAMLHPCYYGKTIFDLIQNTSLLEGDIIRYLRQILDRIGQIKKASSSEELLEKIEDVQKRVIHCLQDVDLI